LGGAGAPPGARGAGCAPLARSRLAAWRGVGRSARAADPAARLRTAQRPGNPFRGRGPRSLRVEYLRFSPGDQQRGFLGAPKPRRFWTATARAVSFGLSGI